MVTFKIDNKTLNSVNLLEGTYSDFTPEWYKKVGSTIAFTLLMNTVSPHIAKILIAVAHSCIRKYDRGC
jgi:hypothetical protein